MYTPCALATYFLQVILVLTLSPLDSFLDEKRSVQFLKEQNSLLIGEDGQIGGGASVDAMEVA